MCSPSPDIYSCTFTYTPYHLYRSTCLHVAACTTHACRLRLHILLGAYFLSNSFLKRQKNVFPVYKWVFSVPLVDASVKYSLQARQRDFVPPFSFRQCYSTQPCVHSGSTRWASRYPLRKMREFVASTSARKISLALRVTHLRSQN